jgi:hypothetical protein
VGACEYGEECAELLAREVLGESELHEVEVLVDEDLVRARSDGIEAELVRENVGELGVCGFRGFLFEAVH